VKALTVPQVNVSAEAKIIIIVSVAAALVVLSFLATGLNTLAAIVSAFGFLATLERFHRLFGFFRMQRKFSACVAVVCIALFAFAAVCVVFYLGTPMHTNRAP